VRTIIFDQRGSNAAHVAEGVANPARGENPFRRPMRFPGGDAFAHSFTGELGVFGAVKLWKRLD
jgi:hypothetical protein